jgi:spore germination protein
MYNLGMQKENILLAISIVLSIAILTFAIVISVPKKNKPVEKNNQYTQEEVSNQEVELIEESNIEEIKVLELEQIAWIPAFDFNNGFKSLQQYQKFTKVSPVFYGVNSDGSLINRKPPEASVTEIINYTNLNDIKLVPTIGSYDYNVMRNLLQSPVHTNKHIQNILSEIDKYNYHGIDLDYEKIRSSEKEQYLKFLKDLGNELKLREKYFSITVMAKTRDTGIDTLDVQDYKVIGEIADEVRIMTYDYTLQTSTTPGPIGPLTWIEEVMEYALTNIPKEKIVMGIHLYSYLWKEEKASALTHTSAVKIIENPKINGIYKTDIGEGYAEYTCSDGSKCIIYYQTKEGVNARIEIAKRLNIKGVTYWRLGNEGDLLEQNL